MVQLGETSTKRNDKISSHALLKNKMCNDGVFDFDFRFEKVGKIGAIFRKQAPTFFYMVVFARNKI